jgi:predicted metal-binding membrane protein
MESILKRDRLLMGGALLLVTALAWAYILAGAGMASNAIEMTRMSSGEAMSMSMEPGSAPMTPPPWSFGYAMLMFVMWWVMMLAMMLPSAAPTILLASALNRKARADRPPFGGAGFFAAGYLFGWGVFSLTAVVVQWGLEASGGLCSMMRTTSPVLAGVLLIAAALWQFTPVKRACLRRCRSPVEFLARRRREGNLGALSMGMEHGAYCLGCCWFLMTLLFVGGVMNLYWIIGLAALVLTEKMLPYGRQIGRIAGVGAGLWGLALIAGTL